jgi:TonB-linked SusC/RagA family outer membrane protein
MFRFLFIGFFSLLVISQATAQFVVSGKISEKDGSELPGVNVILKNSEHGTITDANGFYQLEVPSGNETLIFSSIGFRPQEISIGGRSRLDVVMQEDVRQLQEIVVTGFQEVDRKLFTGASTHLDLERIKTPGLADVSRMLEGQAAGVTVDNVTGTFGTSPKIRIRGNTSIHGDNQPLWVVDGVVLEDLNHVSADDIITGNANTVVASSIAGLNPDDIESFQILKDASATAMYGTRAKNGVIVITTKRGKSGRTVVNYSGNYSGRLRPSYNQFDILNSKDEMSIYREMYEKGLIDVTTSVRAQNYGAMGKMFALISEHEINWGPGGTGSLNEEFLNKYETANTDWFDVLFRNFSVQQQHSISLTSGTENHNSYYSLSFLNDDGQTIADRVRQFSGMAKNSFFFSKNFALDLKLNGNFRQQTVPGTQNRDFDPITGRYRRDFDINPLSYALNTSRSVRAFDDNGDYEHFRRNYAPFNIVQELQYNYININVADVSTQADLNFHPHKDISIRSAIQGRYASTKREHIIHEYSNQAEAYRAEGTQYIQDSNPFLFRDPDDPGSQPKVVLPEGGFNYLNESDLVYFYVRNSFEWGRTFNDIHSVNVLGGQEIKFSDREGRTADGLGVVYENGRVVNTDPNIIDFLNRQGVRFYGLYSDRERFAGFFLNSGYAFKSRYIVNGTIRYDGSNRLGKSRDSRYLPTWNVSGAWNIDQEPFFKVPFLNSMKLRATYGLSANMGPSTSALLNLRADVTLRPTDTESYLYIDDLENQDLTWEKLNEFNVGIDFGMFNNRISGSLDYYLRNSFDLIGILQTSGIGGIAYKWGNYADMASNGFEVSLNAVITSDRNFSWSAGFNIGYTKDRITRLDFGPRIADAISQAGAALLDGPRRGIFSTRFAGLDYRGMPTFYDQNDEVVHYYDLQERENLRDFLAYEGPSEPTGAGGFTNNLQYGNLSLSVLLSYKFGYKIRLDDAFRPTYTDFNSFSRSFVNRWVVPGDERITDVPVILDREVAQGFVSDYLYAYDLYNKSTARIANGDYLRLKTVRLGYLLPHSFSKRIGAASAQISIEAQNMALLYSDSRLNGQDPEFFSSGGVALPQPRQFTLSLNVGF